MTQGTEAGGLRTWDLLSKDVGGHAVWPLMLTSKQMHKLLRPSTRTAVRATAVSPYS
jgi:hypothetical protein